MLNSLITLQCEGCDCIFEKHTWAEGNNADSWLQALNSLLVSAHEDDWLVTRYESFHLCPDCALDGVCPG